MFTEYLLTITAPSSADKYMTKNDRIPASRKVEARASLRSISPLLKAPITTNTLNHLLFRISQELELSLTDMRLGKTNEA